MFRLSIRRVQQLATLLLAVGFATPAFAQPVPPSCATSIDNLGELVRELDGVLGERGPVVSDPLAAYGALGGPLDSASLDGRVGTLSSAKRRELAGKLLTIIGDESLSGDCDKSQIRYNAAMVLDSLARKTLEEGGSRADYEYFVDCLLKAAEDETDPAFKRQMALNLDRLTGSMTEDQQARAATMIEEYLPQSPAYETVFGEDGQKNEVTVLVHAGDETFEHSGYDRVFRDGNVTKNPDGSMDIEYVVTPDDPTGRYQPVTYKIKIIDEFKDGFHNLDIFNGMDQDDPAIEVYNFHSQYGSGLSKSIVTGVENPDSKKIYFLGSCKSKVNAGRIEAKYPKIGSIYTRDSEYFVDTPRTLKRMLTDLVNRPTWTQISRSLDSANLLNRDNYFFPHDRRRLAYVDSDLDGIPDLYDTGVNCGLSDPPQSNSFAASSPVAEDGKLSGEKIGYAVTAANGVLGYSSMVSSLEDKFVADGWAPADPDGPRFVFTPSTEDGPFGTRETVKVKVNAAYSHMSDTAMSGAMLREFVMHEKSQGGATPTRDDEILAYAMGVKLFDAWSNQGGSAAYREYQEAYNLGRDFSLHEAASKIDHHRGVTRATVEFFRSKLDENG